MSLFEHLFVSLSQAVKLSLQYYSIIFSILLCLLSFIEPTNSSIHRQRDCFERIWPDFQRCRERQRDHFRYGRFSSGFSFSSDVYQPKYRTECCSFWELLECAHKAAKIYCSDDVDIKKLDKFVEMVGLEVPLYICADEYPKGSFRCKLSSWFVFIVFFVVFCFLVLLVFLFICFRRSR